ncbi:MAG TPA: twin-arginine translocase subunit TatC [Ktedonobacterales bacterium]|nr:twin-arginine translocase subunit TatC [Ktedonobacterales bacterium]
MATSEVDQERLGLLGDAATAAEPEEEEGGSMTLVEHLEELRRRLFYCALAVAIGSIVAFIFWDQILGFLLIPLPKAAVALTSGHGGATKLVVHGIGEQFAVALKLAFAVGMAVASPVTLYQVWGFIAPGLTRKERKYAGPFTVLGVALFLVGIAVGFVVLRYPVEFLLSFGANRFTALIDADNYFSFVAFFLLAFGIVFELPLVLTFLGLINVVSSARLREKRLYYWFGLWVASCFITPGADPYSPVIIGVALTLLFELSIILLRIIKR